MFLLVNLIVQFCIALSATPVPSAGSLGAGSQPQLSVAPDGLIRLAFGRSDSIFCAGSQDGGEHFSNPELVGVVKGMHLGMTRGPQLAVSSHVAIITAMDKKGNIHLFRLNNKGHQWEQLGFLNDRPESAPEGLMAIAANERDEFFAVWLDIRQDQHNNIYFSSSRGGAKWSPNRLVYASPDGHVCECCKPGIAAKGQTVAIMFRNWLGGARDLYCSRSGNSGASFEPATKLGQDSWPLNGCPMDGGGITIDNSGQIHTAWRRANTIFYCRPGMAEQSVGEGRLCGIAVAKGGPVISMQQDGELWLHTLADGTKRSLGKGAFLKTLILPNNSLLCAWEAGNQVKYRLLP